MKAATSESTTGPVVSERALVARIKRHLAKDGSRLRTPRGEGRTLELGRYYIVDAFNVIDAYGITDVANLARECGVLRPGERLAGGA